MENKIPCQMSKSKSFQTELLVIWHWISGGDLFIDHLNFFTKRFERIIQLDQTLNNIRE